jgi:hypothetical protein
MKKIESENAKNKTKIAEMMKTIEAKNEEYAKLREKYYGLKEKEKAHQQNVE